MPTLKAIHIGKSPQKANRTTKTCQRVCLSQRTADWKVQQILKTIRRTKMNASAQHRI